jgi:alkylation response protein AidB-like acyl-CoA dehydrogenase
MALREMVEIAANDDFAPTEQTASAILMCKTIAVKLTMQAVKKVLEVVGGTGFFRALGWERLLRDVHGAQFHPLPEKRQLLFTGRLVLGLDPVS